MQLPVLWPVSVSTRTLTSQGIEFLETLKNPANLFKNNLNNTRNNMKSQIKKKEWWDCWITNTNIKQNCHESRNSFCCNYEQSSQNNQCTWCSSPPSKAWEDFFQNKASHKGTKSFFGKIFFVVNWRTNDQIMPKVWEEFHKW